MTALCGLPGGIGVRKCGHGLASLLRETSSVAFLTELLVLCRYPANSGGALLSGVLPLRCCATVFSSGHVADLVTEEGEEVGGNLVGGPGKTPAHLVYQGGLGRKYRPSVWKRLRVCYHHLSGDGEAKRRCLLKHDEVFQLSMTGWGLAESRRGMHMPTLPDALACI